MTPADFARLIGVSKQAVSKACAAGRLSRSVTRDELGRVVGIEPEEGKREWLRAKAPQASEANEKRALVEAAVRREAARGSNPAPSLVLGGVDPLEPGRAFVGVRFPLGRFLTGAAGALRDSGREASPEALRAVVEGMGEEAWWVAVIAALNARLDPGVSAEQLLAMWESEGRAAVEGEPEATDGNQ
jgi:hypothetical protein